MNSPAGRHMTFAFVRPLFSVVLPAETHLAIVLERHQAAVGDRDPVGVAGEVGQHLLGPGERCLGVDHPLPPPLGSKVGSEEGRLHEPGEIAEELDLAPAVHLREAVEEQAPEQTREHPYRQEEARPAGGPTAAIEGDAAGRHDAVHVRVVVECLPPAVQHGDDPDPRPEVLGIGGDRGKGVKGGSIAYRMAEQNCTQPADA